MSDGRISIDMTLQQAEVVAGLLKVLDKEEQIAERFGKISKEAVKAERDMKRFIKLTTEAEMTPREVFDSQYSKLLQARKAGLDKTTFDRALDRARNDYRASDPFLKKQAEDAKALADATHKANVEMERLVDNEKRLNATPLENYNNKMDSLRKALGAGKMSEEEFKRSRRRYLGEYFESTKSPVADSNPIAGIVSVLAPMMAIRTAIDAAASGIERMSQQRSEGYQLSQSLRDPRKDLVSVSNSAQDYARNNARGMQLSSQYPVSQQDAMSAYFMAKSGDFNEEELVAMMDSSYIHRSPALAANVMVKARGFKGVSGRQALNMVGVASKSLPATTEEVSTFLPQALAAAQMAGFALEEALAIIGQLSKIEKNFGVAADRAKAMFGKISLNKSLMKDGGGINALKRATASSGAILRYFKDDFESRSAATMTSENMGTIEEFIQTILQAKSDTGTGRDYLDQMRAIYRSDPIMAQLERELVAKNLQQSLFEKRYSQFMSQQATAESIVGQARGATGTNWQQSMYDYFKYSENAAVPFLGIPMSMRKAGYDISGMARSDVEEQLVKLKAKGIGFENTGNFSTEQIKATFEESPKWNDEREILSNLTVEEQEQYKVLKSGLSELDAMQLGREKTEMLNRMRNKKGTGKFIRSVHGLEEKVIKPVAPLNGGAGSTMEKSLIEEMDNGVPLSGNRRVRSAQAIEETASKGEGDVDQYLRRNSGAGFKSSQTEVAADPQLQESNLLLSQMLEVQKQTLNVLKSAPQQEVRNNRAVTEQDTVRRSR